VSVTIPEPDDRLFIETDAGTWTLVAEGDCCSESWFDRDHLEGADLVVGEVVTAVENRDEYLASDGRTRQEQDSVYGTEIRTAKGCCVFEMRNSSNGYYGGSWTARFEPRASEGAGNGARDAD
jgi:hypothetical protein